MLMQGFFASDEDPLTEGQLTVVISVKHAATDTAPYARITLTEAEVAGHRQYTSMVQELEEVSFNYTKIEWTYVDGGITAEDDWEASIP